MKPIETTQASLDHLTWENPMGETRKDALRLNFDRKLKPEFHETKVTSNTGLPAMTTPMTPNVYGLIEYTNENLDR